MGDLIIVTVAASGGVNTKLTDKGSLIIDDSTNNGGTDNDNGTGWVNAPVLASDSNEDDKNVETVVVSDGTTSRVTGTDVTLSTEYSSEINTIAASTRTAVNYCLFGKEDEIHAKYVDMIQNAQNTKLFIEQNYLDILNDHPTLRTFYDDLKNYIAYISAAIQNGIKIGQTSTPDGTVVNCAPHFKWSVKLTQQDIVRLVGGNVDKNPSVKPDGEDANDNINPDSDIGDGNASRVSRDPSRPKRTTDKKDPSDRKPPPRPPGTSYDSSPTDITTSNPEDVSYTINKEDKRNGRPAYSDRTIPDTPEEEDVNETPSSTPAQSPTQLIYKDEAPKRTQVVASIEFKPLVGNDTRSPMQVNILGEELNVTKTGTLLEVQIQLKEMVKQNVKFLFDIFISPSGVGVNADTQHFEILYGFLLSTYKFSGGSLFASFQKPNTVAEVIINLDDYIAEIRSVSQFAGARYQDYIDTSQRARNYVAAIIYYFLSFVFANKIIFILTQGSNTQNVLETLPGTTNVNIIEETDDQSSSQAQASNSIQSLLNKLDSDITPADLDSLLYNHGITKERLSPSQNMLRVIKAIGAVGLGLQPNNLMGTVSGNSDNSSFDHLQTFDKADEITNFLENTQIGMTRDDSIPYTILYSPAEYGNYKSNANSNVHGSQTRPNPKKIISALNKVYKPPGSSEFLGQAIYQNNRQYSMGQKHNEWVNGISKLLSSKLFTARLYNFSLSDKAVATALKKFSQGGTIQHNGRGFNISNLIATYSPSVDSNSNFLNLQSANKGSAIYFKGYKEDSFHSPHFHYTHVRYDEGIDAQFGPRSSGVQSNDESGDPVGIIGPDYANKLIIGRPITGVCFDTNYPKIQQFGSAPSPPYYLFDYENNYTAISIFDSMSNLPCIGSMPFGLLAGHTTIGEIEPYNEFNKAPFKLSNAYSSEIITNANGTLAYNNMADKLGNYIDSIVKRSVKIFNGGSDTSNVISTIGAGTSLTLQPATAGSGTSNSQLAEETLTFQNRKKIAENFFKDIAGILEDMTSEFVNFDVGGLSMYSSTFKGMVNSILIQACNKFKWDKDPAAEDMMAKLCFIMLTSCIEKQQKLDGGDPFPYGDATIRHLLGKTVAGESVVTGLVSNEATGNTQWSAHSGDANTLLDAPHIDQRYEVLTYSATARQDKDLGLFSPNLFSRFVSLFIDECFPRANGFSTRHTTPSSYDVDDDLKSEDYFVYDHEQNTQGNQTYTDFKYYNGLFALNNKLIHLNYNHDNKISDTYYNVKTNLARHMLGKDQDDNNISKYFHPRSVYIRGVQGAADENTDALGERDLRKLMTRGPVGYNQGKVCSDGYGLNQKSFMVPHITMAVTGIKDVVGLGLSAVTEGSNGNGYISIQEGDFFIDVLRRYMFNYANDDMNIDLSQDMGRSFRFNLRDEAQDEAPSGNRNSNFLGSTYSSPDLNPTNNGAQDMSAPGYGLGTNVITNFFAFFGILTHVLGEIPMAMTMAPGDYRGRYNKETDEYHKKTLRAIAPHYDAGHMKVAAYALLGYDSIPADSSIYQAWFDYNQEDHGGQLDPITADSIDELVIPDDYIAVFNSVKNIRDTILSEIVKQGELFAACLKYLEGVKKKVNEVVDSDEATSVTNVATPDVVDFLAKHEDLFFNNTENTNDCVMDTQQIVNIYANSFRLMTASSQFIFLPSAKDINSKSVRKMVRCLAMKNKGFRTEEISMGSSAFNKTNKLMMSVGIPCGSIQNVQENKGNKDGSFTHSTIGIVVSRVNLLNDRDVAYVNKVFYYDTKKFILDNSKSTSAISTLDGFNEDALFQLGDQDFLDHSILYHLSRDIATGNMCSTYLNGYAINSVIAELEFTDPARAKKLKEVYINHLIDYYLKMYIKLMTGIDVDEDVFLSSAGADLENPDNYKDIALKIGTDSGAADMFENNFLNPLSDVISQLGPTASNLSEYNRLVTLAKRTTPFTADKYLHRTVIPKKFDRVFTMLIDEGDFIPVSRTGQSSENQDSPDVDETFDALVDQGFFDNLEGGDMHTLGKVYTDFQDNYSAAGVFDEDSMFSDETLYQYHFSIVGFEQSFDFQTYLDSKFSDASESAQDLSTGEKIIAGKINVN
jgi:hypothetical protein